MLTPDDEEFCARKDWETEYEASPAPSEGTGDYPQDTVVQGLFIGNFSSSRN